MKSLWFAATVAALALTIPTANAADLGAASVDTPPAADCFFHVHTREFRTLDQEAAHLLDEAFNCALACILHPHTLEMLPLEDQIQHELAHLHRELGDCVGDATGAYPRAANDSIGVTHVCEDNPCVEPVSELGDGEVTVGLRHHLGLGGSVLVTVTDHSVRVSHSEGITVCWVQVDVEDPNLVDQGCVF